MNRKDELSRIGLLQLAVGKTASLTRIGKLLLLLLLLFIYLFFKFDYVFIINSI